MMAHRTFSATGATTVPIAVDADGLITGHLAPPALGLVMGYASLAPARIERGMQLLLQAGDSVRARTDRVLPAFGGQAVRAGGGQLRP